MARNKAIEERVKTLVSELLAEEEADGQPKNINDIEDAMVRIGDMVAEDGRAGLLDQRQEVAEPQHDERLVSVLARYDDRRPPAPFRVPDRLLERRPEPDFLASLAFDPKSRDGNVGCFPSSSVLDPSSGPGVDGAEGLCGFSFKGMAFGSASGSGP
mgnify:CR=1 FL=1